MKKVYFIFSIMILVIATVSIVRYKSDNLKNSIDINQYANTVDLQPIDKIYICDDAQLNIPITVTGLSYDETNDVFWLGNYGKENPESSIKIPSILKCDSQFQSISDAIIFDDSEMDIQGVAYDADSKSLWFTDGKKIFNCTLEGNIISSFGLGKFEKYKPNGVFYDKERNAIWILCFYNYLLCYDTSGHLINEFESNFLAQDHIYVENNDIYISVGDDYHGNNNYVIKLSTLDFEIIQVYRVIDSFAVEGICVVDDLLYVANDGRYHDTDIKENYISRYRLSE